MQTFIELLLLQILTGSAFAFTIPSDNFDQNAHQPSQPAPSSHATSEAPSEQRACRDDRVDGLIKLLKSQHEEQMKFLRTVARCQSSGLDSELEYQEYVQEEEPEYPVPAPNVVAAPYEVPTPELVPTPYEVPAPCLDPTPYDAPATYEVSTPYEIPAYNEEPAPNDELLTFYDEEPAPSEVPTVKKHQTRSTTLFYSTTTPAPTTTAIPKTTATPITSAPPPTTVPPTRASYQSPPTTTLAPPAPTVATTAAPPPTRSRYQGPTLPTPVPTVYTTTSPPTRARYQSPLTTTLASPAPSVGKYQTQPTVATTAAPPPPTSSRYAGPRTTTLRPPPILTATMYQEPSPDDLIPEEYDESRSFSIFPECDGDCPIIPVANPVPRQSLYQPPTTEYEEPPPVAEQGSGLGNHRTIPKVIIPAVTPVSLHDEELEEIMKELEKNYPTELTHLLLN